MKVSKTNVNMFWIIGLAVLLIVMVVAVLFIVVMPKFKIVQNMVDKLNLVSREILTGLPVIRAFHTEKHEEERFDKANKDLTKLNLFVNRAMTFMMPTMMLVMNGITVLIVWVGGHSINDGAMQVRRYDGIYPVCNADYYVIPYDLYDFGYASKSSSFSRACG